MEPCLTPVQIEAFVADAMAVESRAKADAHLQTCERCRAAVEARRSEPDLAGDIHQAYQAETVTKPQGPTADTETRSSPLPRNIAGYQILREIHRGGQGVVYQAVQKSTKRKVAIKILLEGPYASKSAGRRFEREIELVAQLQHPNIIGIFHSGRTTGGQQYFVMDYIRGVPLDQYVHDNNLTLEDALKLFATVCEAVSYAHHKGVIHRDLKPSNILVDASGEPKVLDFGLAKQLVSREESIISLTGQVVGTLPYMSPEQAEGNPDKIDIRTDVYALGVILYQMLTGHYPYPVVGQMADVLKHIAETPPTPPSRSWKSDSGVTQRSRKHVRSGQCPIDNDVQTIVMRTLAKERQRRYQSAGDLAKDVQHYLADEPIEAKRDSRWYVLRKSARRHRLGITSTLLIAVVIIIAGGYALRSRQEVSRTTEELLKEKGVSEGERESRIEMAERVADYEHKAAMQEYLAAIDIPDDVKMPPPADATLIDPDATISINLNQKPTSLNPLSAPSHADVIACEFLFERLFWRTASLELTQNKHLIASLEQTDDPRVKLVHLQPGLTWHDGRPLIAEDIAFSWEQTIKKDVGSSKRRQASRLQDVIAINPTTVKFVFKEATPTWKLSMNFEIVPRHLFETHIDDDPTLRESEYYQQLHHHPVGSGPFQFVRWDDEAILLKRWPSYTGEKPRIDRLSLRWVDDSDAILDAFMDGRLDLCTLTDKQYTDDLVYEESFTRAGSRMRYPISTFLFIMWNCRAGSPFEDRPIRRAMTHALNVERILDQVRHNLAAPCYGPWPILTPYFDQGVKRLAFNLKRAAELLDEAGWRVGPDGRRIRTNGEGAEEPFEFDLMVDSESKRAVSIATIFKDDLANIGVTANIFPADWSKEFTPRKDTGQFDALILATTPAVDPGLMRTFFKSGGTSNWGGYHNQQVDDLFAEAAQTLDDDKRAAAYQRLHRLIYQDQPMTFLYEMPSLWAVSKRLRGVSFSVRGPFLFHPGILRWWVPRED